MLIIYYVPVQNKIKNTLFKRRTLFNLNPHCVIHIRPTNKTYRHGASKMFCETKLCIINYPMNGCQSILYNKTLFAKLKKDRTSNCIKFKIIKMIYLA